jgi:2-dehydropantoate 2-reductase
MEKIASEALLAAKYNNIILPDDIIEKTFSLDQVYLDYKTSSLQDVEKNRIPEIDEILGPVVTLSKAGYINAPYTETIYELLKARYKKWYHTFPRLAADTVVVCGREVLLIERKNEPFGWALPGGMAEYGEKVEKTAVRELWEETGLRLGENDIKLLGVYSAPNRDSRGHTVSIIYYAILQEKPELLKAGDDAANAAFYSFGNLPKLAFDHKKVIQDFINTVSVQK